MTGNAMLMLISGILFFTFILGWLAHWLFHRLDTSRPVANEEAMQRMYDAERALELREQEFSATEAQYANAYAQLEAELDAAMSGLGEARREAAELRQKLGG